MKKCIVISDSFKGSLSSGEICEIARESFQNVFPACKLVCIPVADGGEGTVACFQEVCGGEQSGCRAPSGRAWRRPTSNWRKSRP